MLESTPTRSLPLARTAARLMCAGALATLLFALNGCGGGGSGTDDGPVGTTAPTTPGVTPPTTTPSSTPPDTPQINTASFEDNETSEITATLTTTAPNFASSSGITLTVPTTVWAFTWAEFSAQFWAVDAANAQRLQAGQSFQGFPLAPAGQSGFNNVSLPAGTWFVGVIPNQAVGANFSNRIYAEMSSVTLSGAVQVGNVPLGVSRNPGGYVIQPFTVPSGVRAYIETEGPAGLFAVMSVDQANSFAAAFPNGFNGGTFGFLHACGPTSGDPAIEIECELKLAPGNYALAYINNTGSASGGAANIAFFQ